MQSNHRKGDTLMGGSSFDDLKYSASNSALDTTLNVPPYNKTPESIWYALLSVACC